MQIKKLKHIKINFIKFKVLLKCTIIFIRNNSQKFCLLPLARPFCHLPRPFSHVACSSHICFSTWPGPATFVFKRTSGKLCVVIFIYKIQMLFHPIECAKTENTLRRPWKVAPSGELPLYVETPLRLLACAGLRCVAWLCVYMETSL